MARPRSEKSRKAVLSSMRQVLLRGGYSELTIEGLAQESGVSKQTIYRWWTTKAEILGESLLDGETPIYDLAPPSSSDLEADIRRWLESISEGLGLPEATTTAHALLAVSMTDPDLSETLNKRYGMQLTSWLEGRLDLAKQEGLLRDDVDLSAIGDQIVAMIAYAALLGRSLKSSQIDAWVRMLLRGILR